MTFFATICKDFCNELQFLKRFCLGISRLWMLDSFLCRFRVLYSALMYVQRPTQPMVSLTASFKRPSSCLSTPVKVSLHPRGPTVWSRHQTCSNFSLSPWFISCCLGSARICSPLGLCVLGMHRTNIISHWKPLVYLLSAPLFRFIIINGEAGSKKE